MWQNVLTYLTLHGQGTRRWSYSLGMWSIFKVAWAGPRQKSISDMVTFSACLVFNCAIHVLSAVFLLNALKEYIIYQFQLQKHYYWCMLVWKHCCFSTDYVSLSKHRNSIIILLLRCFVASESVIFCFIASTIFSFRGSYESDGDCLLWIGRRWRLLMIKLWNHGLLDARMMNSCNIILEKFQNQASDPKD